MHFFIQVPNITLWFGVPCLLYLCQYWDGQDWLWMLLELSYNDISDTCSNEDRSDDLEGQGNCSPDLDFRCRSNVSGRRQFGYTRYPDLLLTNTRPSLEPRQNLLSSENTTHLHSVLQ
ncbi:hypothetical protein TNCV_2206071 [Trichonephila clavipes]|nr:hypothetical protein TNCV_2206071 [Trichonephila clavipes]